MSQRNCEAVHYYVITDNPDSYEDEDSLSAPDGAYYQHGHTVTHVRSHLFRWGDIYTEGVLEAMRETVDESLACVDEDKAEAIRESLRGITDVPTLVERVQLLEDDLGGDWGAVVDHGVLQGLTWLPRSGAWDVFHALRPEEDCYDWETAGYRVQVAEDGITVSA